MSIFDPSALKEAPSRAVQDFAQTSPAPAVLIEIARGGLSLHEVAGSVTRDGTQTASIGNQFEVGSQTKMMTSVIIQQLVGEGLIAFDASLAAQMDLTGLEGIPNIEEVTVRELLANRSGIPDFDTVPGETGLPAFIEMLMANPDQPLGPDGLLALASGQPANFAPGEAYAYSNTNFLLLQKLAEQVTGASFGELLSERIFSVTGMEDSALRSEIGSNNLLHSYASLAPGQEIDVTEAPLDLGAAGGVVSTTADMIRFFEALLVSGTLLSPEQMEEMLDFRAPDGTPGKEGESLGLSSGTIFGQQFIGFQGGTLGTNTATFLHVESGTIFSVATTHSNGEPIELLVDAFTAIFDDASWASFDPTDESFAIAGTAAEITLSEACNAEGNPETVLTLDGVSLTFEGGIGELDSGRFSFSDGSTLWIGSDGIDRVDILRDAPETAGADNQLLGLDGNDHLRGGHGNDRIEGGAGRDHLRGRDGDDVLDGGAGDDTLRGDHGDDRLTGGEGRDRLSGGAGDDVLSGGDGNDLLRGGAGDDVLEGGAGRNTLWGGSGADTFVFQVSPGQDRIFGFDAGEDLLDFSQTGLQFDDLAINTRGAITTISYGEGEVILFGTSSETLTEDCFLF